MTRRFSRANLFLIAWTGLGSVTVALLSCLFAGLVYFSQEVEYQRFREPGGRYEAVVMVPRGSLLLPIAPGSGGDSAGSVQFYDADGNVLGTQPVARVGDAYVEWDAAGRAYVGSAGNLEEWELGEMELKSEKEVSLAIA